VLHSECNTACGDLKDNYGCWNGKCSEWHILVYDLIDPDAPIHLGAVVKKKADTDDDDDENEGDEDEEEDKDDEQEDEDDASEADEEDTKHNHRVLGTIAMAWGNHCGNLTSAPL
jgi:hypothetical protein